MYLEVDWQLEVEPDLQAARVKHGGQGAYVENKVLGGRIERLCEGDGPVLSELSE